MYMAPKTTLVSSDIYVVNGMSYTAYFHYVAFRLEIITLFYLDRNIEEDIKCVARSIRREITERSGQDRTKTLFKLDLSCVVGGSQNGSSSFSSIGFSFDSKY